jgi:hypothetical protein
MKEDIHKYIQIFEDSETIKALKQHFSFYGSFNIRVEIILKILSHIYVDYLTSPKDDSKSNKCKECYCKLLEKYNNQKKQLPQRQLSVEEKRCLDILSNREVWICDKKIKDEFEHNRNKFYHLFQSRIDKWKRGVFPLDIINCMIKGKKGKSDWKENILSKIKVLTSGNNYYYLNEIAAFDFRREKADSPFMVFAILKGTGAKLQVMTPCAFEKARNMEVYELRQVSIDHEIPLSCIANFIIQSKSDEGTALDMIINARNENPKLKAKEIAGMLQIEQEVLINLKKEVLDHTRCTLMEQKENSRKSNIVSFQSYEYDKDEGVFTFIVADEVENPDNNLKYRIFYTSKCNKLQMEKI